MPLFRYEVTDRAGKTLRGAMDAPSEVEVRRRLSAHGYLVNLVVSTGPQAQPRPRTAPVAIPAAGPKSRARAPAKEMAVFFRGLASFLTAGVAVHEALVQIGMQTPNRGMNVICREMAASVQAGNSLSTAMARFPRAFPPHVIGTVAAGELGGFLAVIVGEIALDYEIARKVSSTWLTFISKLLWLNALLSFPFVPFPIVFFSPGVTSLAEGLIKGLRFCLLYGALPTGLIVIAYYAIVIVLRLPGMRRTRHALVLRSPLGVGRASKERSLASFSAIMWRLQQAGILPINAWATASHAAENIVVAERLHAQVDAIRSGRKLSEVLAATGLFTSEDQRLVAMGEMTGQVPDILQRIADYYSDAAMSSSNRVKWLGFRIALTATLLSLGAMTIAIALMYPQMMRWVEWYINVE